MKTTTFLFLFLLFPFCLTAQAKKKLKGVSFKSNTIEFANSNLDYSHLQKKYIYLPDSVVIEQLIGIMKANPKIVIEVAGHTDNQEDSTWAMKRATLITQILIDSGIEMERLETKSYGSRKPLVTQKMFGFLESQEEVDAAHQKNRRVNFQVSRIDYSAKKEGKKN